MALANSVVEKILTSPAHQILSGSTVLIRYHGRRTDTEYTTPVQYADASRRPRRARREAGHEDVVAELHRHGPAQGAAGGNVDPDDGSRTARRRRSGRRRAAAAVVRHPFPQGRPSHSTATRSTSASATPSSSGSAPPDVHDVSGHSANLIASRTTGSSTMQRMQIDIRRISPDDGPELKGRPPRCARGFSVRIRVDLRRGSRTLRHRMVARARLASTGTDRITFLARHRGARPSESPAATARSTQPAQVDLVSMWTAPEVRRAGRRPTARPRGDRLGSRDRGVIGRSVGDPRELARPAPVRVDGLPRDGRVPAAAVGPVRRRDPDAARLARSDQPSDGGPETHAGAEVSTRTLRGMDAVHRPTTTSCAASSTTDPTDGTPLTVFGAVAGVYPTRLDAEERRADRRSRVVDGTLDPHRRHRIERTRSSASKKRIPEAITVVLGYYALPGVPTMRIDRNELDARRWTLRLNR